MSVPNVDRLQAVFCQVCYIAAEDDINRVILASNTGLSVKNASAEHLAKSLKAGSCKQLDDGQIQAVVDQFAEWTVCNK